MLCVQPSINFTVGCVLQEGLFWAFEWFLDLNTEVNFCLKEVLELEEKMEEEEDLGLEVIVGGVTRRRRDELLVGLYGRSPAKMIQGGVCWRFVHRWGRSAVGAFSHQPRMTLFELPGLGSVPR